MRLGSIQLAFGWTSLLAAACTRAPEPEPQTAPLPTAIVLEVPATPDSAIKLTQFALQAVDGQLQLPKLRPTHTTVSLHYVKTRKSGGQTQVAVMAAVARTVPNSARPITTVELSAWMLDIARPVTRAMQRSGRPITPVTTDAGRDVRPRAATARDVDDWASLEYVAEVFVRHGARRLP